MITTFNNFINESNFQFEHEVEKHFDDINFLCFDNEIQKVPIQFVNKSLTGPQLNWSTPEKEIYAKYYSVKKLE